VRRIVTNIWCVGISGVPKQTLVEDVVVLILTKARVQTGALVEEALVIDTLLRPRNHLTEGNLLGDVASMRPSNTSIRKILKTPTLKGRLPRRKGLVGGLGGGTSVLEAVLTFTLAAAILANL